MSCFHLESSPGGWSNVTGENGGTQVDKPRRKRFFEKARWMPPRVWGTMVLKAELLFQATTPLDARSKEQLVGEVVGHLP